MEHIANAQRYARNKVLSPAQQAALARGRVLIVGLGGLGGHVLDILARTGVGHLWGADGDVFEASNLNRQLLCTESRLGQIKAQAALEHVRAVNSSCVFTPLPRFLRGEALEQAVQGMDVVVDALGGLEDREALQQATARAGVYLVSAGVAGLTGWVAAIGPGEPGPAALFGNKGGAEEQMGSFAPCVAMAAALQSMECIRLLSGQPSHRGLLVFDLAQDSFTRFAWS